MSRSIHENRSHRHFVKKGAFDSRELSKKHRVKTHSVESPTNTDELVSQSLESIPILIGKANEYLFFPSSIEEITQVIGLLPPGAFSGIKAIHLKNGKHYVNEHSEDFEVFDPFTAMKSYEVFPNIFIPMIRGMYSMDSGIIEIYAYVKCPQVVPTSDQALELRLQMLCTLIHEIAHHQDRTTRIARGRWRMDDDSKAESFAEKMSSIWCHQIIIPFLKQRSS